MSNQMALVSVTVFAIVFAAGFGYLEQSTAIAMLGFTIATSVLLMSLVGMTDSGGQADP